MGIDAYINANDQALVYQYTYYHAPERWQEASLETKKALNRLSWSGYIKYIGDDDIVSRNSLGRYAYPFWNLLVQYGDTRCRSSRGL